MSKKGKAEVKSAPPKATVPQASAGNMAVTEGSPFAEKIQGKEMYLFLGALVLTSIFVFRDFLTFEKVYLFKHLKLFRICIISSFHLCLSKKLTRFH